jgi:hypothetical protein
MSDDQQIDEIRDDIEQTRTEMSQTIDQIEARLSPDALQDQASEIINRLSEQLLSEFSSKSDEISSKISEQMGVAINSAATQKLDQVFGQASTTAKQAGSTIWHRLAENPVPVALAAVGIGLMAAEGAAAKEQVSHLAQGVSDKMHQAQSDNGQGEDQSLLDTAKAVIGEQVAGVKEQVSHATTQAEEALHGATEQAGEKLHGAVDQATSQGRHLASSASSMMPGSGNGNGASARSQAGQGGGMLSGLLDNPGLAGGLLALGLGLVAGLGAPETEKERQLAAPLREKALDRLDAMGISDPAGQATGLIDQVKQSGAEFIEQAKQTGAEIVDEAKATAQDTAGQLKETAQSVKQDAAQATESARASATGRS